MIKLRQARDDIRADGALRIRTFAGFHIPGLAKAIFLRPVGHQEIRNAPRSLQPIRLFHPSLMQIIPYLRYFCNGKTKVAGILHIGAAIQHPAIVGMHEPDFGEGLMGEGVQAADSNPDQIFTAGFQAALNHQT